jgi:hypothetical protein
MEDAVEPREDLLGHLGHIAVVERAWLTVSGVLAEEMAHSFKYVLEAWPMLPETCVPKVLYAIMMYDIRWQLPELHAVNVRVEAIPCSTPLPTPHQFSTTSATFPLLPSTTITASTQNATERQ